MNRPPACDRGGSNIKDSVVLLGAGASVDAGVPASTAMTEAIVRHIDVDRHRSDGVAQALKFAVGALIAHDTGTGGSPFSGIDVERLFAAVQVLASRSTSEVAPFVAAWSPVLDSIGAQSRFPSFFDSDLQKAILGERFSHKSPERLIRQAIEAVAGRRESEPTFRALEQSMTEALRTLVAVDPGRVDYLAPLLNLASSAPLRIATLNYDLSVEHLVDRAGLSLDTGIAAWEGAHDWSWHPDAQVRLLKLHGSINWVLTTARGNAGLAESRVEVESEKHRSGWPSPAPALVFGARGKLRSDGPFLAMLRAFDDFLAEADALIVVGYSFRDEHINTAVRRWLNAKPARRLTIVDPAFPTERQWNGLAESFADELLNAATIYTVDGLSWNSQFRVVSDFARDGLVALLGDGPTLVPAITATAESASS